MNHIEAMKQALEALENSVDQLAKPYSTGAQQAITTLRTAIEEAEKQGPVATLWQHGETGRTRVTMPGDITDCDARWFKAADLYTTPPAAPVQEPRPISDFPELQEAVRKGLADGSLTIQGAAPVQEPDWQARLTELQTVFKDVDQCGPLLGMGRPPAAQRQWVGLTDEQAQKILEAERCWLSNGTALRISRAIEAKLREKNGGAA